MLGSSTPLLGLTQYCFGAVVFTLKRTVLLLGLRNTRLAVMTSLNGPENQSQQTHVGCMYNI